MNNFKIASVYDFTGIANKVALSFDTKVVFPKIQTFADGEVLVSLRDRESYKDRKIFIIESIFEPIGKNLLNLLLFVYELKRNGVKDICVIFPYISYMRQDNAGGMQLIAKIIEASGVSSVGLIDMHSQKIPSFFSIPVYHISLASIIARSIKRNFKDMKNITIVAPDQGARFRAQEVAKILGRDLVVIKKQRTHESIRLCDIGVECKNKNMIIVDDIIDSASTAICVAERLLKCGASNVVGYFSHPVFSGDGLKKAELSNLKKIFVSNTIPTSNYSGKIKVFDCVDLVIKKVQELV